MNRKINLWISILVIIITGLGGFFLSDYLSNSNQNNELSQSWERFTKRIESHKAASDKPDDFEINRDVIVSDGNCFNAFRDTMISHGFTERENPILTKTIIFGRVAIRDWLAKYKVFDNCDRIEVKFGVYTKDYIAKLPVTIPPSIRAKFAAYEGRIGVFLWPSRNDGTDAMFGGKSIPAFDLGGLEP